MSEYLLEKAKTCYHCKPLVDENEILSRKLAELKAENDRLRDALTDIRDGDCYPIQIAIKALRGNPPAVDNSTKEEA